MDIYNIIEKSLSFKYISNLSIIVTLFAYYTNAYYILFIFLPLMITNLIVICILELYDIDTLIKTIFNVTEIDNTTRIQFAIINTLWHLLPILWIYHMIVKDNLIDIFRPNMMEMFLICCVICIIYFYYGSQAKIYGNINYASFLVIYICLLLGVCSSIYFLN